MKVFLTGSNGLLGQNVLRQLLYSGYEVNALVRPGKEKLLEEESLAEARLNVFLGSILKEEDLAQAMKGCQAVINCAGDTHMNHLRLSDYRPVNVDCVRLILNVMNRLGIRRMVHISTANTIGYGSPTLLADESIPMSTPFAESFYALSKQEGERIVIEASTQHSENHFVVVNPGFMLGAHDLKISSGQLLLAAYRKPIMIAPKGGKSFVPVGDAARAIVNALEMGRNGERYLLTGENLTLRQFYQLQAHTMGYKQWLVDLPDWLALAAGKLGDLIRFLGIPTQLSSRNIRQLLVTEHYSNQKATNELQMPHSELSQSIQNFFATMRID